MLGRALTHQNFLKAGCATIAIKIGVRSFVKSLILVYVYQYFPGDPGQIFVSVLTSISTQAGSKDPMYPECRASNQM